MFQLRPDFLRTWAVWQLYLSWLFKSVRSVKTVKPLTIPDEKGNFNCFLNSYLGWNTRSFALTFPAHPLTSHHVLQVWLPISQKVDKDFRLHGGKGDFDSSPGEIAGMVPGRRALHLLLGLVHPLRRLVAALPGLTADGDVQLCPGNQNKFQEKNPEPAAASHHGAGLRCQQLNRKYRKAFNHF